MWSLAFTVGIKELWSAADTLTHLFGGRESTTISRIMSPSVTLSEGKEVSSWDTFIVSFTRASVTESRHRSVILARTNISPCWLLFQICRACSSEERHGCSGSHRRSQGYLRSTRDPRLAGFRQRTTVFCLCFPPIFVALSFSPHNQQPKVLSEQRRIGKGSPDY